MLVRLAKMLVLCAMFCSPCLGQDMEKLLEMVEGFSEIERAVQDERTYWYNDKVHPQMYQHSGNIWLVGINFAANHPTGSANNQFPWRHAGGTDRVRNLFKERFIWLPPGEKIRIRSAHGGSRLRMPNNYRWDWTFPTETVVGETLSEGSRLFEVRVVRKNGPEDWDIHRFEDGLKPAGYVEVDSCTDCHVDIGRQSFDIPSRFGNDWYGYVRGAERIFTWHPFSWRVAKGNPRWPSSPIFNSALAHMYEFDEGVQVRQLRR